MTLRSKELHYIKARTLRLKNVYLSLKLVESVNLYKSAFAYEGEQTKQTTCSAYFPRGCLKTVALLQGYAEDKDKEQFALL